MGSFSPDTLVTLDQSDIVTQPKKGGKSPEGEKKPASSLYEIRHEKLVADTSHRVNPETGQVEEFAGFDRNLHRMMVSTVGNQLTLMLNLRTSNRDSFDRIMADESHQAEADLLNAVLSDDRKAVDFEKLGNLVSEQGVDNEHKSGNGWQLAMTVLEHNMTREMYALGMAGAMTYHGEDTPEGRKVRPEALALSLSIDQSKLNKLIQKYGDVGKLSAMFGGGGALVGAAAKFGANFLHWLPGMSMTTSTVGGAGIGLALMAGGGYVMENAGKSGFAMDQRAFADGLRTIQGNPSEREFMTMVYGIDASNFTIDPAGGIYVSAPTEQYKTVNIQQKQKELYEMMILRMKTYQTWGVDLASIDAFPEQAFLSYADAGTANMTAERSGAVHAQRIDQKFFSLCQDRGGTPPDTQGQIMLRQEARRLVMGEMIQELLDDQLEAAKKNKSGKASTRRDLSKLDQQKILLAGDPSAAEAMGARAKKVSEEARKDKAEYTEVKNILSSHEGRRSGYESARIEIATLLAEAKNSFGTATLVDIEAEIVARNNLSLEEVKQLRTEITRARDELVTVESNVQAVERFTTQVTDEYARFTGAATDLAGAPTHDFGIETSFLATANIDSVFSKINLLHEQDVASGNPTPRGWSASENHTNSIRIRVMKSMTEARAQKQDPTLATQNELNWVMATKALSGITETQIHQTDPDTLIATVGMIDDGAGAGPRALTRAEAILAIKQSRYGLQSRVNAWKTVVASEVGWTKDHNATLVEDKAAVEAQKTAHQTDRTNLDKLEKELSQLSDIDKLSRSIDQNHIVSLHQDESKILAFVGDTKNAYSLNSPQSLRTMTFTEAMSRINTASKAKSRVVGAWGQAENSQPENIRAVVAFLADVRAANEPQIKTKSIQLTNVEALGINEHALIGAKPEDIFALIQRNKSVSSKLSTLGGDQNTIFNTIRNAITEAGSRHFVRSTKLAEVLQESRAEAQRVQTEIDAGRAVSPKEMLARDAQNAHLALLAYDTQGYSTYTQKRVSIEAMRIRIQTELGLATPAQIADLDAAISLAKIQSKSLRTYENMDEQLRGETEPTSAYQDKLIPLIKAEGDARRKLKRDWVKDSELNTMVQAREKHTDAELVGIRDRILEKQARMAIDHAEVAPIVATFETGRSRFEKITSSFDAVLVAVVPAIVERLDPAALVSESYKEIVRRINLVHQNNPAEGWPPEENAAHRDEVVAAILEASIRVESPHIIQVEANYDRLTDPTIGLSERQLLELSTEQLLVQINEQNRKTGHGWAEIDNVANIGIVQAATAEAQRRLGLRINASASKNLLIEVGDEITEAGKQEKRAVENLSGDRFFVEVVKEAAAAADRRLFPWVRSWAGPNGDARKDTSYIPVRETDREYTAAERFSVQPVLGGGAGTERMLPKSYYNMLNALTGYQDLVGEERAEKFQQLVEHPEFSPAGVFDKLNKMFNLGLAWAPGVVPPVDLNDVFVKMRQKFHFNPHPPTPASLNGYKVHEAFEALIDDMIDHAGAL